MSYRKVPIIYTLDMGEIKPDYRGLIIRMKSISFGQVRKLIKATEGAEDENFDDILAAITSGLVSWNLEDEDGIPIPATEEGLNDQDFPFVLDIVQGWLDQMTSVGDDLGKGSPSGPQFPGRPVTMEAL